MRKWVVKLASIVWIAVLLGCGPQAAHEAESSSVCDREIIPVDLSAKEMVVEILRWQFPEVDPEAYEVTEWAQEFLNEIPEIEPYITECYAVGKTDGDRRPFLLGCLQYNNEDGNLKLEMSDALIRELKKLAEGKHLSPHVSDDGSTMVFAVMSGGHGSDLSIYASWVKNGWFADEKESPSR